MGGQVCPSLRPLPTTFAGPLFDRAGESEAQQRAGLGLPGSDLWFI
jgi:hypothetical protein